MCGIVGTWNKNENAKDDLLLALKNLSHRGPDDQGLWSCEQDNIFLGHRRLAILDLSPLGHQPMLSATGRFVLAFNGEIYNFQALKKELHQQWKSNSDTEVLLAAFETWGIEETLKKCRGMFAIVLYDNKEKTLTLARDAMGEKPLYYGWKKNAFWWGSELKAFMITPDESLTVNHNALANYLHYNYVPTPQTIFENVFKLEPGHFVTLHQKDIESPHQLISKAFFHFEKEEQVFSFQENLDRFETLLGDVVRDQMLSDVSLGAFLSGGIDSSLIVALMGQNTSRPIQTFSIGFDDKEFDEAHHARAVAKHLNTQHTDVYISTQQAQSIIEKLPEIYDEPFADVSQIPTFLVSELAKKKVTVALSGDGGDELFGGYSRYFQTAFFSRIQKIMPSFLLKTASHTLGILPEAHLNKLRLPGLPPRLGSKLNRLSKILPQTPQTFYQNVMTAWKDVPHHYNDPQSLLLDDAQKLDELIESLMSCDAKNYLPDDILVKVDRAAMANSLEVRAPFLDQRIVDFANSLPSKQKFHKKEAKRILKKLLYKHVPKSLIDRPKQGFGVPIGRWLQTDLKNWAHSLLDTLEDHPYLDSVRIKNAFHDHLSGKNRATELWSVLMYLSWYQKYQSFVSL